MSTEAGTVIRKFNPGMLQSDEEIKEQFVVRSHELDLVLDELRGNIDSASCQHILVVSPRGRGKTMLLARIAAELRSNGDFAGSLLPVRFMEESPEVFNLTDFWLETMFHLANEVDAHDAALARELRETRAALASRWREQIIEAQARAAVFDAADRLGRRLVLIAENLQSLCRDAHDEFGWQLREVLQTEPQIILLASATSLFRELDEVDEPFFEMFRIVGLKPLDTEECSRLWKIVSGKPATSCEVRPLQILTGGNPRLLVMAAEYTRHRSIRRLMSELVTLIDEHTEYFRGHLEVLAKTERRVYVSVIDLWQPSSASEIAARARVDIRVASTMLGRLVERGAVIRQGRGRKRLYSAAEPLYSMYYKLRRERDEAAVVENLIRFMVACYGVDELWRLSRPLTAQAAESGTLRRGIGRALRHRPHVVAEPPAGSIYDDILLHEKWRAIQQVSDQSWSRAEAIADERLHDAVEAAFEADACERVIKLVDEYVASGWVDVRKSMSDIRTAWTTYLKVRAHEGLQNPRDVLAISAGVVGLAHSRNMTVLACIAPTLAFRANAQLRVGDFAAATVTCDDILRRFGCWDEPPFAEVTADALLSRGSSRTLLGDHRGAIRNYEEVMHRFADSERPEIQWGIASALMNKGLACRRLGDSEREIRSYDAVIERFESADVLVLRQSAAVALSFKCMAQAEIGLADEALDSCRQLDDVARCWTSDSEEFLGVPVPWAAWLKWRAGGARALALTVRAEYRASIRKFRAAYAAFLPEHEGMMHEMVRLVPTLIGAGVPPLDLLAVFASDTARSSGLRPLVVALEEHAGNQIRAPREVREVAADIRDRFSEAAERMRAMVRSHAR